MAACSVCVRSNRSAGLNIFFGAGEGNRTLVSMPPALYWFYSIKTIICDMD
jgi:hypothetical protein